MYKVRREMKAVIGIDVSKAKIDCAWLRDTQTLKLKSKVLPNTADGHQALLQWAEKNTGHDLQDIRFICEATGVYHEALAYALHAGGADVVVMNPAHVREYAKSLGSLTKTDKKDSLVLARYGATQICRPWQPEPAEVRQLKALLSRLDALEQDLQRENNRLEKATVQSASPKVIDSIEAMITHIQAEIERLKRELDDHIDGHPQLRNDSKLLQSIPGVGDAVSRQMLAVYHSRCFQKATQIAAYLGLTPVEYQSGSSVRAPSRISKAGSSHIRRKLYMPSMVAARHNPPAKALYERLVQKGKSKKAALCAVMRKLVHQCFGVLKHQQAYCPTA